MFIGPKGRKRQRTRRKRQFSRQKPTRPEVRENVLNWNDQYLLKRAFKDAARWTRAKLQGDGLTCR